MTRLQLSVIGTLAWLVAARALTIIRPQPPSPNIGADRRTFFRVGTLVGLGLGLKSPGEARASDVPLLGRFESLKGANSFIGNWQLEATKGPSGELVFLGDGDVELRGPGAEVVAVSAVPWRYVSPKGGDTTVEVSFTLDCECEKDVLIYQGTFDLAAGPGRIMRGSIETGRAEIGAKGGGPRKNVGMFTARISS